tara:strand:- start:1268 stop:1492 length:225 start_codon:yes stop_codon:yes gene_type:complete
MSSRAREDDVEVGSLPPERGESSGSRTPASLLLGLLPGLTVIALDEGPQALKFPGADMNADSPAGSTAVRMGCM